MHPARLPFVMKMFAVGSRMEPAASARLDGLQRPSDRKRTGINTRINHLVAGLGPRT
jgi:hypothetical protein